MKTLIIVVEFDEKIPTDAINQLGSEMTTEIDSRLQDDDVESLSTKHHLVTGKFAVRCFA